MAADSGVKPIEGRRGAAAIFQQISDIAPGLAVAITIAAAASFVSNTYGGPVMLLALLLGIALNFLSEETRCSAGISFASKRVLRVGVALLGLRISMHDVLGLGLETVGFVTAGVVLTIGVGILIARILGRGSAFGVLIGGATAICGASAALALSSVLPRRADSGRETIFAVVAVTTLSTTAMVIYPAIFRVLGFHDHAIGILIGATVHDVAQVVGAGYSVSDEAGDIATIVKLFRVALLLPTMLAVSLAFRRSQGEQEVGARLPIPFFAVAFACLVAVNSTGIVPPAVTSGFSDVSRWCLMTAVAAIGLSTSLREISKVGYRSVLVAVGATIALLLYSIATVEWTL